MSKEFSRVPVPQFPQLSRRVTADNKFWNNLNTHVVIKEPAAVTSINFSPVKPFDLAVTCSTRVQLYSSVTNSLLRSISRFQGTAYGATFRNDGNLLVAGGEAKIVQVFDLNSRAILRTFKGHERAVHCTKFAPNSTNVISGSDDKTVKLWDLLSETEICSFEGHQDYVRSLAVSSAAAPHLYLSGSYDHKIRMWDSRSGGSSVFEVDHGAPVEAILMLPRANSFVSAGGNKIMIWDMLGRTHALGSCSNHQKTITCLAADENFTRVLSGSLDHQVKVYDIKDFHVLHSFKFSHPVLSVALSPDYSHVVAGMSNGTLHIRHRPALEKQMSFAAKRPIPGTLKYFTRGHNQKPSTNDVQIKSEKKKKLRPFEKLLKKFQYGDALDAVITGRYRPLVVYSVFVELEQRDGLQQALAGRNDVSLKPILLFVSKHISNPRFSSLLLDVTNLLLDMYGSVFGQSPMVDDCFAKLKKRIKAEVELQQQLFSMMGTLDLLMANNT
eukprot:m.171831 g.171831  ORF g.171831 m.171831 type:complete len:498 (+) comp15357_c0_seq7:304-1797(+)